MLTKDGIVNWGETVYHKGDTLELYLARAGIAPDVQYPSSACACVSKQGWLYKGNMWCFGFSVNNKDEFDWNQMIQKFIAEQPENAWLVAVDCHT